MWDRHFSDKGIMNHCLTLKIYLERRIGASKFTSKPSPSAKRMWVSISKDTVPQFQFQGIQFLNFNFKGYLLLHWTPSSSAFPIEVALSESAPDRLRPDSISGQNDFFAIQIKILFSLAGLISFQWIQTQYFSAVSLDQLPKVPSLNRQKASNCFFAN